MCRCKRVGEGGDAASLAQAAGVPADTGVAVLVEEVEVLVEAEA